MRTFATGDELNLGEDAIGGETVVGEEHALAQTFVENRRVVPGGVVVGERGAATSLAIGLAEIGNPLERVDAGLGLVQGLGV